MSSRAHLGDGPLGIGSGQLQGRHSRHPQKPENPKNLKNQQNPKKNSKAKKPKQGWMSHGSQRSNVHQPRAASLSRWFNLRLHELSSCSNYWLVISMADSRSWTLHLVAETAESRLQMSECRLQRYDIRFSLSTP